MSRGPQCARYPARRDTESCGHTSCSQVTRGPKSSDLRFKPNKERSWGAGGVEECTRQRDQHLHRLLDKREQGSESQERDSRVGVGGAEWRQEVSKGLDSRQDQDHGALKATSGMELYSEGQGRLGFA